MGTHWSNGGHGDIYTMSPILQGSGLEDSVVNWLVHFELGHKDKPALERLPGVAALRRRKDKVV